MVEKVGIVRTLSIMNGRKRDLRRSIFQVEEWGKKSSWSIDGAR